MYCSKKTTRESIIKFQKLYTVVVVVVAEMKKKTRVMHKNNLNLVSTWQKRKNKEDNFFSCWWKKFDSGGARVV